jgi:C-terminal processing protease CtpA/Prc
MGQTTFGKGTIQVLIPLDGKPLQKMPGGIRLTVAKFYFSGKSPDGGRGITPHDLVNTDTATLINTARQHLRDVMGMMMPPMNMPTTMPIRQ